MQKYAIDDARNILERASARETAARVALGTVAAAFLEQVGDIRIVSHTVAIGPVAVADCAGLPHADDVDALDADPVRCRHAETSAGTVAVNDECHRRDSAIGGVVD